MEIQELMIRHYGKFENHRISLESGVNIIYGGNEAGKSTIHSFIRAVLFGLGRGRGQQENDAYQQWKPWEHPDRFAGSMVIRQGAECYRIDRNFDSRSGELHMTDLTQNCEIADPEAKIRELTGGISEAAFLNTVFITQTHTATDQSLAQELRRCIASGESGTDRMVDATAALESLRRRKRQAEQKKQKEEELLEARIAKKQAEAEDVRRESRRLTRQLEDLYHPNRAASGAWDASEDYEDEEEYDASRSRLILEILLAAAGILALAGAAFLQDLVTRVFLGVFGILFLLLLFPVHRLLGREAAEEGAAELDPADREKETYLRESLAKREDDYRKLQQELEKLCQDQVRVETSETEIAALNLAIDRICELTVGTYGEKEGSLNQRASQLLKEMTNGRYDRIVMDETGEIRIHTPDRILGLSQVSSGTMQQIYFAVRMAAGELLGREAELPLILDEPFVMYDEERLEAVLRLLHRSGRQVLLFTCQQREREKMNRVRAEERQG